MFLGNQYLGFTISSSAWTTNQIPPIQITILDKYLLHSSYAVYVYTVVNSFIHGSFEHDAISCVSTFYAFFFNNQSRRHGARIYGRLKISSSSTLRRSLSAILDGFCHFPPRANGICRHRCRGRRRQHPSSITVRPTTTATLHRSPRWPYRAHQDRHLWHHHQERCSAPQYHSRVSRVNSLWPLRACSCFEVVAQTEWKINS